MSWRIAIKPVKRSEKNPPLIKRDAEGLWFRQGKTWVTVVGKTAKAKDAGLAHYLWLDVISLIVESDIGNQKLRVKREGIDGEVPLKDALKALYNHRLRKTGLST